ncbi:MAG: hypothetical protein Q9220_000190 [cf. Caloplaca sp. 1 TL-2023]
MAGFVVAQNSTSSSSGSSDNTIFDVNSIDLTERENNCNANPISYVCTCANGTSPDLDAYANTFNSDECQARFAACRTQNPGSNACIQCGTLKADDVQPSSSSTSASSTAAATSTGTSAAGGATNTAAASTGGNTRAIMGAEMGVKGLVAVLLGMMGLML